MNPASGDQVEVRRPGLPPFWGTVVVIPDFGGKDRPIFYVKPDGRNPKVGRCLRSVAPNEVRKLSLLELIAQAASEEENSGQASGS